VYWLKQKEGIHEEDSQTCSIMRFVDSSNVADSSKPVLSAAAWVCIDLNWLMVAKCCFMSVARTRVVIALRIAFLASLQFQGVR
jgi:hypothetical protein